LPIWAYTICKPARAFLENIDLSGKPVYDYQHCANCMACIQACPTKAIQFVTVKEPNPQARYRNPHIRLDEIIRANEQA
jgi:ferredoxin